MMPTVMPHTRISPVMASAVMRHSVFCGVMPPPVVSASRIPAIRNPASIPSAICLCHSSFLSFPSRRVRQRETDNLGGIRSPPSASPMQAVRAAPSLERRLSGPANSRRSPEDRALFGAHLARVPPASPCRIRDKPYSFRDRHRLPPYRAMVFRLSMVSSN